MKKNNLWRVRRTVSVLTVLITILILTPVLPAQAAAPTGALTGAVITAQVGQLIANTAITVTDVAVPEITAVNDICIKINDATNATWNTADTTTAAYGGTAAAKASTTVTYPGAKILKINVTADFAALETLIITGLGYIGTASSAGAVLQWSIDNCAAYGNGNANTAITVTEATSQPGRGPSDVLPPTSFITGSTDGATITAGQPYTIKGRAMDDGGSLVQKIEVSLDGGKTWQGTQIKDLLANVFSWEYIWQNPTAGDYTVKARATDTVGNVESLLTEVKVTVSAVVPPAVSPEKPITEMTAQELEAKILDIQQKIVDVLQQLIQILQQQIQELSA